MQQPVSMQKPTWVDTLIDGAIGTDDPAMIAQAIANSPQFQDAIRRGLANKPKPGVSGPSHAQNIRKAIQEALAAD